VITLEVAERVRATASGLRGQLVSQAAESATGAFLAWYDLVGGLPSFDYPEITGYALTYLASVPALTPVERGVGERAGAWLAERIAGGKLAARDGWDNGAVYLFDLGMIASGLLSFGRRTGIESLVDSGRRVVAFLRHALDADETLSPIWRHGPGSDREAWSTRGRAHLAKVVQALLLDGDTASDAAAALVDRVKRLQHDDGRVETGPEPRTMLHPHLYAAEGLWIWGVARGDADALERARAAAEWCWEEQLPNGGFPRTAGSDVPVEQSDVTAQALRLAVLTGIRSSGVGAAAARLTSLARPYGDGCAIVYQPGAAQTHANTCATLFAAQALATTLPEARELAWNELV
jgi:hypothetical protein